MLENEKVLNEVDDDDLEEIAGGGTYAKDGYLKTTIGYSCSEYECKRCGAKGEHLCGFAESATIKNCGSCKWHSTLRCNNPANKR